MLFTELVAGTHLAQVELIVVESYVRTTITPKYEGDILVVGGRAKEHWVGLQYYDKTCEELPIEVRREWYHFLNNLAIENCYSSNEMIGLRDHTPNDAPKEVLKFLELEVESIGADLDLVLCRSGLPEGVKWFNKDEKTGLHIDVFDNYPRPSLIFRRAMRDAQYE